MVLKNICLSSAIIVLIICFVTFVPKLSAHTDASVETREVSQTENAIVRFKRERTETRERQLEELMSVMTDKNADWDIRRDAGDLRLEIIKNMEKEFAVESVLTARGFADAACVVHNDSATVLVLTPSLSQSQSGVIMELAVRETGKKASDIKIIPISDR